MFSTRTVTFRAAPNIALVKYWGKRDRVNNLPLNSSISLTLNNNDIYTQTTVSISDSYTSDCIVFNGEEEPLGSDKKILKVVTHYRSRVKKSSHQLLTECSNEHLAECHIRIDTYNSFPTAAGMASSASGIACLTKAMSELFQLHSVEDEKPLNEITRMASGSACRSLYGGLVKWERGDHGFPSIAKQIYDETYWPEIRIAIAVVSNNVKSVGSTEGMNRCVESSSKMKLRSPDFVENRITEVIEAYTKKDFDSLAELIMKDSDNLHEICNSANPPINYLSQDSYVIIELVKAINMFYKHPIIAYSFDAGSNAFLFYEMKNEPIIISILLSVLQPQAVSVSLDNYKRANVETFLNQYIQEPISIKKLFLTTVGSGPCQLLFVFLKHVF